MSMNRGRRNTLGKPTNKKQDSLSPQNQQIHTPPIMEKPVGETPDKHLEKSPIRELVDLKDVKPDEWKNIALPLVDAIKALMVQISQLSTNQHLDSRKIQMNERQANDNSKALGRELAAIKDLISKNKMTVEEQIRIS